MLRVNVLPFYVKFYRRCRTQSAGSPLETEYPSRLSGVGRVAYQREAAQSPTPEPYNSDDEHGATTGVTRRHIPEHVSERCGK